MRFFSFVQDGFILSPVEVQINLLPGLPEMKFSGLVDTGIKESETRLKSAFRKCGYGWPTRKQIIINISPACVRKTSLGMDLALACALLWKLNLVDFSKFNTENLYAYGEVGLDGGISAPEDFHLLPLKPEPLITGELKTNYRENVHTASCLRDISLAKKAPVANWEKSLRKPPLPQIQFSPTSALILKLCATGEHPLLLCGETGSGKTTLVENLYYLLSPPSKQTWEEGRQMHASQRFSWRPHISPHHTTTPLSMIGGGVPLFPGEISKAHGGQLVMDEYLEFHPKVQEALREPMEKGKIRLTRRGLSVEFPSQFLLTATTNLCPCGDYVPGRPAQCSYSLKKCQSHLDRLSGPMLDRFDLLAFSKQWKGDKVTSLHSILEQVKEAQQFRKSVREQQVPNGLLTLNELEAMLDSNVKKVLPQTSSHRRKRALLRVARTYADLHQHKNIKGSHIEHVYDFSMKNFFFLKNRIINH